MTFLPAVDNIQMKGKPILHYVLGMRFGKVCEQNVSKTQAKRENNMRKTQLARGFTQSIV